MKMSASYPIHIFILTNTLEQGGAEKQSVMLAKALNGYSRVTLIVYYSNILDERLVAKVNEYKIETLYLTGLHFKKLVHLFKLFKSEKKSAIISYLITSNLINAVIGGLAGVQIKIGGIRNSQLDIWKMIIERFLHNYLLSATIFNNYEGLKKNTQKGFNSKKSHVIHNCIDIQEDVDRKGNDAGVINILSVGRFVVQKDYYTALKTIQLLKQKSEAKKIKLNYFIVGFGSLEDDIRLWIKQLGIVTEVKMVINPPNLLDYLRQADIYLSTSIFEGLSNSIMEAMEFSLPVVATNVGDNKYLVQEGKTGFLTPVKDVHMLSSRIEKLVQSKDLRIEMGQLAYQHLKQNFTEKVFTKKYLKLISSLAKLRI